jgi:hypothetical protein
MFETIKQNMDALGPKIPTNQYDRYLMHFIQHITILYWQTNLSNPNNRKDLLKLLSRGNLVFASTFSDIFFYPFCLHFTYHCHYSVTY